MRIQRREFFIYFAQYLVTNVDDKEKKKVLEKLTESGKTRMDEAETRLKEEKAKKHEQYSREKETVKEKVKGAEAKDLAVSELTLKERQEMTALEEQSEKEKGKIKEIVDSLFSIVKAVKPLHTLTEDEYLRLLEYDAVDCFEVAMGGYEGA